VVTAISRYTGKVFNISLTFYFLLKVIHGLCEKTKTILKAYLIIPKYSKHTEEMVGWNN